MGEFADMETDRILSNEHEFGGLFSYGRDYPTSIRCKRCGNGPLDWRCVGYERTRDIMLKPIWRLHEEDGTLHVCPPPDPKTLFEDIS